MFFLGFAGPIVPYLLLTGIMLVLTLGTSKEALAKVTPDPEEKQILFNTEQINHTNHFSCYQISFQDDEPDQSVVLGSALSLETTHLILPHTINDFQHAVGIPYFKEYSSVYFGLSPPCLA
ncbi:hypothetical protein [Gaoshiqia sp. Z1-71]|uniref:hypothetical protein n=1 Tax=Gaoshiqia hydrogeniformans TaxID=3290090 RepID=UPI003BF8E566